MSSPHRTQPVRQRQDPSAGVEDGLSTRLWCPLQHSYAGLEIFAILIMGCKFERVITKGSLPIALGSKEPGIHNPVLTSVLTVCQTLIMSSSEASLCLFIK